MTEKKEKRGFTNFGFSTILLSFVMICVVTFSALSLVTAQSDYKLSKKVADKTRKYYEAEVKAYDIIAKIDSLLINSYYASTDEANYYTIAEDRITDYGIFEITSDAHYFLIEEQISSDQYLSIKLKITYPYESTDTFFEIIEWKSIYKTSIPEDGTLNLIQ